jgi:hypothetical protein
MHPSDIEIAATLDGALVARLRTLSWREMALAGEKDTPGEWHKRLLDAGLLVEGSRAAANADMQAGDPRRDIVAVHRCMQKFMQADAAHTELKNPGPWNSGAVRMGATAIFVLVAMVFVSGIKDSGPMIVASLLCVAAVIAMWTDMFWRQRLCSQEWANRLAARDKLRASVTRIGTRSWVAPLGHEVIENTPHLDLLRMWLREVRQELAPWQDRLRAMAPLEDVEGLPAVLIDECQPKPDPVLEAQARHRIAQLGIALEKLEGLEQELVETRDAHRRLAATGELPTLDGLEFDLNEVRRWLRKAEVDPGRSGQNAQEWFARGRG